MTNFLYKRRLLLRFGIKGKLVMTAGFLWRQLSG